MSRLPCQTFLPSPCSPQSFKRSNIEPVVLVTDYDMSEMNGLELIVHSHQIHPTLKTVLLSGTVDGTLASLHPARVHRFLGKPYQPAQLEAGWWPSY